MNPKQPLDLTGNIPVDYRVRRATIPKTRDPFINTHLLALGPGPNGRERFWTSSCNMVQGTTCLVLDEEGTAGRFRPGVPHWSFYGAVQEDADTIWLCTRMSRLTRFSLRTGRFAHFETDAPAAHVGQGMAFDVATGKLLVAGYASFRTVALSFDTKSRQTTKLHWDFAGGRTMRHSFANGDGSWSIVMTTPGQSLLRWVPQTDDLCSMPLTGEVNLQAPFTSRLISDEDGRRYIPENGWFDPTLRRFQRDGPQPLREMTWFARRDAIAYGAEDNRGSVSIYCWDMNSSALWHLCEVPDAQVHGCNMTGSGKIVAVSVYGTFFRFDAISGAREISKVLPTDAVSYVDCLRRIDEDRVLGTTFITQRFWEIDLKTGEGRDCGRAAPGWGEVTETWQIRHKIYMAAYMGGELTEYDPDRPASFPANPRVVAKPPRGQRPVAAADDGHRIFYSCTRPYPEFGSVLTRYDTRSGVASFSEDPLPGQQICGLAYVRKGNSLLCGTSIHSDMKTSMPATDTCFIALVGADSLKVETMVEAPKGTEIVDIIGPLGRAQWLCTFTGSQGKEWAAVEPHALKTLPPEALRSLPEGSHRIQYAGVEGLFILRVADRIELWDMRRVQRIKVLAQGIDGDAFFVGNVFTEGRSVFLITPWEIVILEDALPPS